MIITVSQIYMLILSHTHRHTQTNPLFFHLSPEPQTQFQQSCGRFSSVWIKEHLVKKQSKNQFSIQETLMYQSDKTKNKRKLVMQLYTLYLFM